MPAIASSGSGESITQAAIGLPRRAARSPRINRRHLTTALRAFVHAARQSATRALELGRGGREVDYAAAFALALAGELTGRWLFYVAVVPLNMPGAFWRGAAGSHR